MQNSHNYLLPLTCLTMFYTLKTLNENTIKSSEKQDVKISRLEISSPDVEILRLHLKPQSLKCHKTLLIYRLPSCKFSSFTLILGSELKM